MDRLTPVSGGFCLFLRGILKKSGKLGQYFDNYSVKGVRISLGCFFQGIVGSDRQVRCKSAFYHIFDNLFLFYSSTKCVNMDRL
jgi:hypothetical protein